MVERMSVSTGQPPPIINRGLVTVPFNFLGNSFMKLYMFSMAVVSLHYMGVYTI